MSVGYVIVLWLVKRFMRNREPLTLKGVSFVHNVFLCLLSLVMVVGQLVGVYEKVSKQVSAVGTSYFGSVFFLHE